MFSFFGFFGFRKTRANGRWLYEQALAASRRPVFYENDGVPDTVDGRFDLLVVHIWLILRALNRQNAQTLGQEVFDAMFKDMDNSLRELGTSDTSVGRRIREMAKVFYDRAEGYNAALDKNDIQGLRHVLDRVFFENAVPSPPVCEMLATYMGAADRALAEQTLADFLEFGPCYPPLA